MFLSDKACDIDSIAVQPNFDIKKVNFTAACD